MLRQFPVIVLGGREDVVVVVCKKNCTFQNLRAHTSTKINTLLFSFHNSLLHGYNALIALLVRDAECERNKLNMKIH